MDQPEIEKPIQGEEKIKLSGESPKPPEETKKMPELEDPGEYYVKEKKD